MSNYQQQKICFYAIRSSDQISFQCDCIDISLPEALAACHVIDIPGFSSIDSALALQNSFDASSNSVVGVSMKKPFLDHRNSQFVCPCR
jgi:hypothetical protein